MAFRAIGVVWRETGIISESTWNKHKLLLDGGVLEKQTKAAVGLGVSATNGSKYFIRYFHANLVKMGWDPGRILEILWSGGPLQQF